MMNWWKNLKGKVRLFEPLKNHTSFKIGGPAEFFIEPKDLRDLRRLLAMGKIYKLPIFILGAGSNILVNDQRIKGIILHPASGYFKKVTLRRNRLEAGSAVPLSTLLARAAGAGLSGLEFMAGIPGTLGGALAMNAGIPGKTIADLVEKVTVMDYNGRVRTLRPSHISFGYRRSGLAKYIILSASLRLAKKKKSLIRDEMKQRIFLRRMTQDLSRPSAGCVFKNPPGDSAGRLIDACGLKGRRAGGAVVSEKHANFFVNGGGARAKDVLKLMKLASAGVKNKFGIELEPEVKIWK